MISNQEKELSNMRKKGDATLQEVHDLYFLAKEKYLAVQVQEVKKTKEASKLVLTIFFLTGRISEEFVEKWQRDEVIPTDKELELLKEGCNEVLAAFENHFKKELLSYQKKPYDAHYAEVKEKIRKIRGLIYK